MKYRLQGDKKTLRLLIDTPRQAASDGWRPEAGAHSCPALGIHVLLVTSKIPTTLFQHVIYSQGAAAGIIRWQGEIS